VPGILLILLGLWLFGPDKIVDALGAGYRTEVETVAPQRFEVVDGDTVKLAGETIRLIGYDTPETYRARCAAERAHGDAATIRLQEHLSAASSAQLSYLARRDRYGRRLAQLSLDGQDVANLMVSDGMARRYKGGTRGNWC